MPAVSQVIRGSRTITDADGTAPTATISAVDLARAIVMATWRGGQAAAAAEREQRETFQVHLSSATEITFDRNSAAFAADCTVEYTVVEFEAGGVTIQTGAVTATADPMDAAITAVDTAATFPIVFQNTDVGTQAPRALPSFAETTNPGDTLRFDFTAAPGANDYSARYQIVEFDSADCAVQTGTISFENDTPGSATITEVDTAKTLVAGWVNGLSTLGRRADTRIDLGDATTVAAQAQNLGTSLPGTARYFVIEMLDGSVVQAGRAAIATSATSPATAPGWATAMTDGAVFAASGYPNATITSAADGGTGDTNVSIALDTPQDSLTIARSHSEVDIALAWQVAAWAASGGGGSPAFANPFGLLGVGRAG